MLGRSEEAWKAWYKKEGIPSFIDKMLNKAQFRCNSNPDNIWYELWFAILLFVEYLKERNASKRRGEGK